MSTARLPLSMILLLLLTATVANTATATTATTSSQDHVVPQTECSFTRYPSLCLDTLRQHQRAAGGQQTQASADRGGLLTVLVEKARQETELSTRLVDARAALLAAGEPESSKAIQAIDYCDELMVMSNKRLDQSLAALKSSPKSLKADIQTWLSAVITFHDACKDSVSEASASGPAVSLVANKMNHLSSLASNALAVANRLQSSNSDIGRHLLDETTGFPRWLSEDDRKLLESETIEAHAVVARDGSGDYATISEALEGLGARLQSGGRTVISLKAGVYHEKFSVSQDNVMLVGAGKGVSVITGSASVGGGTSMPNTATGVINGDGFIAKDVTFENSAGAANHQALALRISSDHAVLYHCSLKGHQDTLYAVALRQFYRECDIYGSIDYIFGNAAAIFQSCNLLYQEPHHKGINTVFANGRSDPGQNTGFVAQGCKIGAGPEYSGGSKCYLGRPWKAYSRAVVMQSSIDGSLQPSGWSPWSGSFGLSTLYFAEYANTGSGAATGGRVGWSGFHVLGAGEAAKFTVSNFLSGGGWISSSGAPFSPGL